VTPRVEAAAEEVLDASLAVAEALAEEAATAAEAAEAAAAVAAVAAVDAAPKARPSKKSVGKQLMPPARRIAAPVNPDDELLAEYMPSMEDLVAAWRTKLVGANLSSLRAYESSITELLANTRRALREKEEEADEERRCSICLARPKQVALNCGHQFCTGCMEGLKLCAMCRTPITHRITLF